MNVLDAHRVGDDGKTPLERVAQVIYDACVEGDLGVITHPDDCDALAALIVKAMPAEVSSVAIRTRASYNCCPKCGQPVTLEGKHLDTGIRACPDPRPHVQHLRTDQSLGNCVYCWQESSRRVPATFIVAGSSACDVHARGTARR